MEEKSWKLYDEFLKYGALDRYTKLWARYELYKMVQDIPGDIVECGVLKGGGILYWARMLQVFNNSSQRKVIGFDSFNGYLDSMKKPHDKVSSKKFTEKAKYSGASPAKIMKAATSLGLAKWIELVEGDAAVTIKEYVQKKPGFRAALINMDFDVYEPTLAALESLYPILVPAGIVIFDEYSVHHWEESNAVDKYFRDKKVVYRSLPWTFSPTAYIIKES